MIKIIAVGKKCDFDGFIADYEKRLRSPFDIKWRRLPYSAKTGNEARDDESSAILREIGDEFVVLLDERGVQFDNKKLSEILAGEKSGGRNIVIIIGGAYGVSDELRARADIIWSLGKLVLPHQIVRLILAEQIYRSQAISSGHPYHHE